MAVLLSEIIVTTGDFGSVDLGTEMVGKSPQVVLIKSSPWLGPPALYKGANLTTKVSTLNVQ